MTNKCEAEKYDNIQMNSKKRIDFVNKHIGNKLRIRRRALGLSQAELGRKIGGITFQQIQKYEKGVNRISSGALYELCDVLMVPITYFYDGVCSCAPSNYAFNKLGLDAETKNIEVLNRRFLQIKHQRIKKHCIFAMKMFSDLDNDIRK